MTGPNSKWSSASLRIKGEGAPQRMPAGSAWQYGTGPVVRAAAPGDAAGAYRPMPMAAVDTGDQPRCSPGAPADVPAASAVRAHAGACAITVGSSSPEAMSRHRPRR